MDLLRRLHVIAGGFLHPRDILDGDLLPRPSSDTRLITTSSIPPRTAASFFPTG